ncbi:Bug family tripartite tricarboxylate transporter substrate binding protein [Variovorax saccharolyticus]|uniref:Bug family tripartite tricarboxylate transporter substrate binding protein n=1 Tax=Variovorax saccharolyticus TaxID=3053516 RepID=UPI002575853E|nr:tripartite tricarboxylate transporter substrate binding protein [Variovorax sp. J22R187]MDM0021242.1 tripartite tricarboxylate transporter substrate binding protein [Variovorax sp. J22R187]
MTLQHPTRRSLLCTAAALPLASLAARAGAQAAAFPTRPITWVVPYPAGGFGDALSRMLAQKISASLRQPVVVDNRPGAGGQIGANHVKQQPADGYTLFYGDLGPFSMNAGLYPKLSYDTLKDFMPLTRLLVSPTLVIVPANGRLKTWQDVLEAARSAQGLNYGSYGMGSQPHIWMEMLKREIKGNMTHVAYKGGAPAVQDLMAGHIDLLLDVTPSSIPLVRENKAKALAVVGSERRLPQLPQVPTIGELGLPSLDVPGWTGIVVKAGTPEPIANLLHDELVKAVQSSDVVQRYGELGLVVAPSSRAEFAELIRAETARWGKVIREVGVQLD